MSTRFGARSIADWAMADPKAYQVLGVRLDATTEQIREAYRAQAKRLHPDQNAEARGDHAAFLALTAAYQLLVDPVRRRAYDQNPDGRLEAEIYAEERRNQLRRRKRRLRRLWE